MNFLVCEFEDPSNLNFFSSLNFPPTEKFCSDWSFFGRDPLGPLPFTFLEEEYNP